MLRIFQSYSTFSVLMLCIALLLPGIFYERTEFWMFLWVVSGIPFAFLGCQAIIYKSDFSPGPYFGSAIVTILSIALPFGVYWNWAHPARGFDLGWVFLWVALLFYVPIAMILGWSIGKFFAQTND